MTPRHLFNGFLTVALLAALLLIGRVLVAPDAGATLFARARQLEAAGQIALALKHYQLVATRHPESALAPRALLREGDLLAARGRQNSDALSLRAAMEAYARLAKNYPKDALSNEALFNAGQIAAEELHDPKTARGFYDLILQRNSEKSDEAATATTKLGRIALSEGNAKGAQQLLQSVFALWPRNTQAGAEAQFHLGVVYETLLKNREWAKRAFDATIERYPDSVWAATARERLGLLMFSDQRGRRPARRVMIDIAPLPDDDGLNQNAGNMLWDALRVLLAARGLNADENVTRGWSLLPFWAGVDTTQPGRVVKPSFDAFENVIANAGLKFSIKGGGNAEQSLRDLQDDIDAAREPLVYIENGGEGRWTLCVGYDSQRGEVFLQERGARYDTLAVASFAAMWKAKSKFGKSYTALVFSAPGEKPRVLPQPTPQTTLAPGAVPTPELDATPQFAWQLPRIQPADAHARALRRAALLLNRAGSDTVALNINGLDYLARELTRLADSPDPDAVAPIVGEVPIPEAPIPETTPLEGEIVNAAPAPTLTPAPATPRNYAPSARAVVAFFGEPARNWALLRRQAATYCDVAGAQSKRNLSGASSNLRLSADSLDAARAIAPQIGQSLTPMNRAALREMARQMEIARDAERAAAGAL